RASTIRNPTASVNGSRSAATIGGSTALSAAIRAAAISAWPNVPTVTPGTTVAANSTAAAVTSQVTIRGNRLNLGASGVQLTASPYAVGPLACISRDHSGPGRRGRHPD